ncbi:reductive dehalogenase [Sulfurospirillum diekertiae]|uniref:reductive dehalogenase n=1 Tax=Sulfurospirillum diekertiae TaxID=1854492 RepID=UPI000B4CB7D8|nr:reductive dehalogenase [Sulfurospirillum diekertiae]ASC93572.1 tetrachloroethene reductive dehalogenase catalytic subunit PceA [Sulfurospirillum diekertiae]
MEKKKKPELSRRDFGKLIIGAGAAATIAPFGVPGANAAEKEKNAAEIRQQFAMTAGSPIIVNDKLERYAEVRTAFTHPTLMFKPNYKGEVKPWFLSAYDEKVRQIENGENGPKMKAKNVGEARAGRALEAAGWTLDINYGNIYPNRFYMLWSGETMPNTQLWAPVGLDRRPPDTTDPVELTNYVKFAARMAGADLVGVARLNRNWVYSEAVTIPADVPYEQSLHKHIEKPIVFKDVPLPIETDDELIIPNTCENVIVAGIAMNREMMQTAPTSMACAAAAFCYSRMCMFDMWLCQFIRYMGYYAIPSCNGVGQSVPFAVEAGLGQASRMGLCITPEFGPNVRLTKVFTNMPLVPDKPIDFGVTEFCETCKKCARECPSKAISEGPRTFEGRSIHNQSGKLQWQNDHNKCLDYWPKSGGYCGICVAVCPFTKGNIWIHDGVEWLIDNIRFLDPLMLGMDDALGYGAKRNITEVWDGKINTYGLDADHFRDAVSFRKDRVKKS